MISPAERSRLISLAYGYLGSLSESEDIVQEAMLRLVQELAPEDGAQIRNREAWLTTVVTRLAIDRLRSAARRREVYPGEWLPEPVFTGPSAEQDLITRSRLSLGLLYLMEQLEPEQRAVYVLREVFEYSYLQVSEILSKSETACRQLMVRARAALERAEKRPPGHRAEAERLVHRFLEALSHGDERALLGVLANDAVLVADGGGKVRSVVNPIHGAERITRFFLGIRKKNVFEAYVAAVNSQPGILTYSGGQLVSVSGLEIAEGRISAIYSVSNPDKLGLSGNVQPTGSIR